MYMQEALVDALGTAMQAYTTRVRPQLAGWLIALNTVRAFR